MKRKLKIIRIQSRICIGGPSVHSEILSKYLDPERFETILIGGALEDGEKERVEELRRLSIQITTIAEMGREISLWSDIKALLKLYQIIYREKPDIVHTHTAKAGAIGRIAAWLAGVPIIIHTFHGHVFHDYFGKVKTWLFIQFEQWLAKITTCIIVISRSQKYDIVTKFRISNKKKVITIPLGLELERFLLIDKDTFHLKNELGISRNEFLIGIVGRIVPIKNHELLLKVIKLLREQQLPVHLCIVGDGELRNELIQSAREKNISNYTHFTGWRLDMEKIYSGMDLLALSSLNEGTPVAIIEAMASQVPVVATAVGGVPDLISDGETGLLSAPNDANDLAEKIRQILVNPEMTTKIIKKARESVEKNYHYRRLINDIQNIYEKLIIA
jgi:glycosyltransferase involved in cell wall biosynthesis